MLQMQADMQHESQFPGCYTSWDLNLDANGTIWPADNVDRIVRNRGYNNGTLPPSSDLNIFYNKDLLKQTMLKHEAEFRDQIHELHRLYRKQKVLMDGMKRNGLYKHHCSLETFQPNCVLRPKSLNYVQIAHHASTSINYVDCQPPISDVDCQPPISEAKDSILPLHSYDGSKGQAGLDRTHIESSSKASELMVSNCKKFGKKILDLELPADEYFDSEEEGFSEVKVAPEVADIPINALKKINVGDKGEKELNVSGNGCNSGFPEGNFIPSFLSSKKNVMADLNIPVKLEEDINPEFSDFQDPVIGHTEPSLWDPIGKSNLNFQVPSKEVNPRSQIMKDPEDKEHLEILLFEHKMQKEPIPCSDKTRQGRTDLNSFPRDLYNEKLSIEHINNEQAQDSATLHGSDVTNGKLCDEVQQVARDISASNYKPVATSDTCGSYQLVPLGDTMNSETSSVSSWRRTFKRSPIAVQALPCFKKKSSKSFTVNPELIGNELSLGKNLLSSLKLCSAAFLQAGSQNDFQWEGQPLFTRSVSLNCDNDDDFAFEHSPVIRSLDLNCVFPNFSTTVADSQDASNILGENTLQNSTGCSSQIAEMRVCGEKSGERRDPSIPLESALEQVNLPSVHDAEMEKVEARNSLGFKSILGFDMYNKPPIANGHCSFHVSPSRNLRKSCAKNDNKDKENERIPDINLEFDHVPGGEKELAKTESVAESEPCEKYPGYGVIDLNSSFSMDESLLKPSDSIEIDLEPPASPENKECSPPRGESDENQLETPLLSSGQEDGDLQDELVRNAVEAIVCISSSEIRMCLESTTCEPYRSSNSLYWFARVASSVVDDPGSEFGVNIGVKDHGDQEEYLSDGIDYFEAMTLNLTEIKVEESWCKSNGQKEEESSVVFPTNQPKRGRTRRGRQQKDFQSEILPSLASLSRYEVTEDLQIIGGLMEAAGAHWESGSSRNAGRIGSTKGRRRSNTRTSNAIESTMNISLNHESGNSEAGIRQRRPIEWGKITRRPRGPRCPSSNHRLILGQV